MWDLQVKASSEVPPLRVYLSADWCRLLTGSALRGQGEVDRSQQACFLRRPPRTASVWSHDMAAWLVTRCSLAVLSTCLKTQGLKKASLSMFCICAKLAKEVQWLQKLEWILLMLYKDCGL